MGMQHAEIRRPQLEHWLGWTAAGCWLASWFLPVVERHVGWEAFRMAITGPFRETFPVSGEEAVPQFLSAFTNVVFAMLLWGWFRGRMPRAAMFLKLASACMLLNLYWPVWMLRAGELRALQMGYYVWLAAFALLVALATINVVSARRTSKTPRGDTPA
jgi:hypothetical protein